MKTEDQLKEMEGKLLLMSCELQKIARQLSVLKQEGELKVILEKEDRKTGDAALVVRAMWMVMNEEQKREKYVKNTPTGKPYVYIGDLEEILREKYDGFNYMNARRIGHILRKELHMEVGKRKGPGYPVHLDEERVEELVQWYGVEVE